MYWDITEYDFTIISIRFSTPITDTRVEAGLSSSVDRVRKK